MKTLAVGDKVAYSKSFLQSTGQLTGDVPQARGKITELVRFGDSLILAVVDWGLWVEDCPPRVNVKNLSRVSAERGVEDLV